MPGIVQGLAVVHVTPALGAEFLQYTLELQPGGWLNKCSHQRFLYVLEGEAELTVYGNASTKLVLAEHALRAGSYAYVPPEDQPVLRALTALRVAVIEKKFEIVVDPDGGVFSAATLAVGHEDDVAATALNGDAGVTVRALLPAAVRFDFAVNTMTYAASAALSQVEIHYMEHGLLMLEGAGTYRLGDAFYEVAAGDFIWMGAFCPQWFEASAAGPAKYLIYKNFNRMPAL
jgi:(S)-ureidoglycine aminohydrolase